MPSLVNMKMKEKEPDFPVETEREYPWGLELNLNDESLERLGMTTLPEVGKKFAMTAVVEVSSASSHDHGDGKRQSVGLQVTDMALDGSGDRAEKLFGDDDG